MAIRSKLGGAVTGHLSWQSVAPRYLEEYRHLTALTSSG